MLTRPRILLLLAVGLALAVGVTHHLQRRLLENHLAQVESDLVTADVARAAAALDEDVRHLASNCKSMLSRCGEITNLPPDVDALWILNPGQADASGPLVLSNLGGITAPKDLPLGPSGTVAGLWRIPSGQPMLVSTGVVPTRCTGEPGNILMLGQLLGEDRLAALGDRACMSSQVWDLGGTDLPPEAGQALPSLSHASYLVRRDGEGHLVAYRAYGDLAGRPQLLLAAHSSQDLSGIAAPVMGTSLGWLSALGVFAWLLCAALTMRTPSGSGVERCPDAGGVLHNVGNVLNSVNISASVVAQRISELSLSDLSGIAGALEEHKDDLAQFIEHDKRGKHLRPLLGALSTQLADEQQSLAQEVDSLNEGIEHICQLIRFQQGRADLRDRVENVDLAKKLDEALRITNHTIGPDPTLEVIREFEEDLAIETDKHRLLEILVNLIQNARQAMGLDPDIQRKLVLRVQRAGGRRVLIEVQDSGQGISAESLQRVFDLGFTTKEDGNGYGLHTAAVTAREMGGALWANSDGAGCGATFSLELPSSPATAHIAGPAASGEEAA